MTIQYRRSPSAVVAPPLAGAMALAKPVFALCVLMSLGGCKEGILAPAGRVGAAEYLILLNSLAIMLAVVIPTLLAAVAFAWWFRASNTRARYRPTWAYSGRLELVVWSYGVTAVSGRTTITRPMGTLSTSAAI